MLDKDPTSYSLLTYAWVLFLASWGGAVNFFKKVREGHTESFRFMEFIGELVTSAFVGVLTFWLCELGEFHQLMTAALVGISGHMGSRAIFHLEQLYKFKVTKVSDEHNDFPEGKQ